MNEEHVFEITEDAPPAANDAAQTPTPSKDTVAEEQQGESFAEDQLSHDSRTDFDPDSDPAVPSTGRNELDELRGELNRLKATLAARDAKNARIDREWQEFQSLYPNVSTDTIPDSVWREVETGIPLAAAYALAERRHAQASAQAKQANAENKQRSAGSLQGGTEGELSPAEVRAMSPSDVKKNFSRIMRSMQKWR